MSRMNDCDSLDDTLGVGADATGPEITRAYRFRDQQRRRAYDEATRGQARGATAAASAVRTPRRNATPPDPARTGASSAWGDRAHNRQGRNPWPR
jgi:hypothetical protein